MDWLLTALAIFNLVSMIAVFRPRGVARRSAPWFQFGIALLATELAWIWLPLQVLITWLLCSGGALESGLGGLALLILIVTWPGLAWSIWMSTKAGPAVEAALSGGLGYNYRDEIPPMARARMRQQITFKDWRQPRARGRPEVEVIRHIPYGPGGVRQQLDIYRPRFIPEGGLSGAVTNSRRCLDGGGQGQPGPAPDVRTGEPRLDLRGRQLPPQPQRQFSHAPDRL